MLPELMAESREDQNMVPRGQKNSFTVSKFFHEKSESQKEYNTSGS
jgi:hypothetical protein